MPIAVVLPAQLKELAGGRSELHVEGGPLLADVLAEVWKVCPALRDRVLTERGVIRPHVNIFIDSDNSRYTGGLESPVRDGAEVMIVPAVSGGAS